MQVKQSAAANGFGATLSNWSRADLRIVHAVVGVTAAGIVVKLAAAGKEVAVAGAYGRTDAFEAFLAAALLPALAINWIAESMSQALMPTLIRVRANDGEEAARCLFAKAALVVAALSTVAITILAAAAPLLVPMVASGYDAGKQSLTMVLYYCLLPLVWMSAMASMSTTALNSLDQFALPSLAPLLTSAPVLAGALFFAGRFGIWALAMATLAGAAISAVVLSAASFREGYRLRLVWSRTDEACREVARQYLPILLSGVLVSGGIFADQAMAAMLPAGSVSALAYANRFISLSIALLGGALSTALAPHFSRLVAAGAWRQCRISLTNWKRRAMLISFPTAIFLMAASRWLVRAVYERGAFSAHDTNSVYPLLVLYAAQIPFFICSRVDYRFLLARRRADLILACGAINLVLDVVLNLLLMRWLGAAGIALSTSLWSLATFLFLGYWSRRILREEVAIR